MNQRRTSQPTTTAHSVDKDQGSDSKGNRSRSRKFKLVILVFSLLLFLALDMLCGSLLVNDQQRSFRRSHPFYHHGLRANQNRRTHWGGRHYSMITNSLGFRDDETRRVPLKSDTRRVVIIGDSMVEGLGVNYQHTVAGQLRQRWSPEDVEVLNAGVVSYSPHLYYLKTRYLVEEVGLQFDQLVVFIDISDIQDETFYETFVPSKSESRIFDWWQAHSLLFKVVNQSFSPETRTNNQFRTDADVNEWMEATEAYHVGTDPEIGRWEWTINDALYESWGKKGLALAGQHMEELATFCDERQIELTVVVYPSPVQIFANDIDSRQRLFWQDFCSEHGLRLIDLFPTFVDHSFAGGPTAIYQRFYQFNDTHWNRAGHGIVADKIDEAIGPAKRDRP